MDRNRDRRESFVRLSPLPRLPANRSGHTLRVHFGLGKATEADHIEIRWPSGQTDTLENVAVDRLIRVEEGKGIVKSVSFPPK